MILLIVGIILDGIWYGVTDSLDACYDQDKNKFYGSTKYQDLAEACAIDNSQTCLCVDGAKEDICYIFNLESANNCGMILTVMPALLLASLILMLVLFVTMLTYSICTCKVVCCTERPNYPPPQPSTVPVVAQTVPANTTGTAIPNKV